MPQLEGELPAGARVQGNVLTLPAVRPEDAGVYTCVAANHRGQQTAYYVLKVQGEDRQRDGWMGVGLMYTTLPYPPIPAEHMVPYFGQSPRSFLPLPTIKDAYKKFEILITFRPDAADGELMCPTCPVSPFMSPPSFPPPFVLHLPFISHSLFI